jgi:hypothetical protein
MTSGEPDGRTDMTKLMVAFGNFANAPKKKRIPLNFNAPFPQVSEIALLFRPFLVHIFSSRFLFKQF